MSQAWAAGGVISTAQDMDLFITRFDGGRALRRSGDADGHDGRGADRWRLQDYGIGIGEKIGGFWGHGGQTLGFESDVGLYGDQDISLVIWTNSARNLAGLGATLVYGALGEAGALEARGDAPRSLAGTGWAWVSATDADGQTLTIEDPQRYGDLLSGRGGSGRQGGLQPCSGTVRAKGDALSTDRQSIDQGDLSGGLAGRRLPAGVARNDRIPTGRRDPCPGFWSRGVKPWSLHMKHRIDPFAITAPRGGFGFTMQGLVIGFLRVLSRADRCPRLSPRTTCARAGPVSRRRDRHDHRRADHRPRIRCSTRLAPRPVR